MSAVKQSIVITKPPEVIFDLLVDPYLVLPLMPGLRSVHNVDLPLKTGSMFSWQFQLLGLTFEGTWTVDELRAPLYYAARSQGGIDSTWTYTLVPQEHGTFVTLEVDYGVPESLIKRYAVSLIEPHTNKIAETYLHALKIFLENPLRTS